MSWSPGMQRWMRDAVQHGMNVSLYRAKRISGGRRVTTHPVIPDEALLTQDIQQIMTQDNNNVLLTDGFINTEGTDPLTTEGGGDLII